MTKHSFGAGSRPTLVAGTPYWLCVGDEDGGATNYVNMSAARRDSGGSAATYYSTNGFASAGTPFSSAPAGCFALKHGGGAVQIGGCAASQSTIPSSTLMRGFSITPVDDCYLAGLLVWTDSQALGHEWRVYGSDQLPGDAPLATFPATSLLFGQAGVGRRFVAPTLLRGGRKVYVVDVPPSSLTVPRKVNMAAGVVGDADLEAAAFPFAGRMRWVAEVAGSPNTFVEDPTVGFNGGPLLVPRDRPVSVRGYAFA